MIFFRILLGIAASMIGLLVAIPILMVALPFWLVALATRAMLPWFQPPVVNWSDVFEFHPLLGWKPKPNFSAYCLEERDDVFRITTGSDGWAGQRTVDESQIVVFGDSHAFGYGVDTPQAFFERADVLIKAIGAPGYNMVQEVLVMEDMAATLKGKLVVWFICYGNDLYDNLAPEMGGYRTPFVTETAEADWRIVTRHISPSKWAVSSGRQGKQRVRVPDKFYKKSFLGDRAFSACEFLIRKGRDICRSSGAKFVIMTIPTPAMLDPAPAIFGKAINADHPDQMIRKICEKLDVEVVCLKDSMSRRHYKRYDEHWNERGHQTVARILAGVHRNHMKRKPQEDQDSVTSDTGHVTRAPAAVRS